MPLRCNAKPGRLAGGAVGGVGGGGRVFRASTVRKHWPMWPPEEAEQLCSHEQHRAGGVIAEFFAKFARCFFCSRFFFCGKGGCGDGDLTIRFCTFTINTVFSY